MARRSPERSEFLDSIIITFVEGNPHSWFRTRNYDCAGWLDDSGRPVTAEVSIMWTGAGDPPETCEEVPSMFSDETITFTPFVTLDRDLIAKGIRVIREAALCAPQVRAEILGADAINDAGMIDVNLADCIVQAALLGDIIYG